MFDSSDIIVGLEIGTSKVCVVVGEINADGGLGIIGVGQAKSRGVRKGEIINAALVEEDVRSAIADAEQMANVEIRSVYLGVTGAHIRSANNRGFHPIVSVDREITDEDMQAVIANAKIINLPGDYEMIHSVRQHFLVDGQGEISNPVGLLGTRLEVDMHVISGHLNRLQNPQRVVRGLQLEIDEVVFNGLASALALLTADQKETGALVIDMGAGVTEYVVYSKGIIRHSGAIAVGGDHVSNDIGFGLKIPLGRAENLKVNYGNALYDEGVQGQTVTIPGDLNQPDRTVNLGHLRHIMCLRLEEIFELICNDLAGLGMLDCLGSGVLLCGGGARIPQIHTLAEQVFQLPVHMGRANSVNGIKSALDQPEFAAGIGLVKYGSFLRKRRDSGGFWSMVTDIIKR